MTKRILLPLLIVYVMLMGMSVYGQDKPKSDTDAEIVFSEQRDGNTDIFVINPDGTNERRLTTHESEDRQPVWSPDRLSILFNSNRPNPSAPADSAGARGEDFGIWRMDSDGRNQRPILADGRSYEFASWSPDGQQIVYAVQDRGGSDLYTLVLDGRSQPRRITSEAGDEIHPAWSPDGTQIAYTRIPLDASQEIALDDLQSGQTRRLYSRSDGDISAPAWSPDGTKLAFIAVVYDDAGTYSEVSVLDMPAAASPRPEAVTTISGQFASSLSWSPDGSSVAYALFQPRGQIRTMQTVNVDGQNLRQIPAESGGDPNWSVPQGTRAIMGTQPIGQPTSPPAQTVQCPGTQRSRLSVGETARVTLGGSANNLRSGPATNRTRVGTIPPGGVFEVLSGPSCANNYAWYEVRYNGRVGWTVEGDSRTYWLEPFSGRVDSGSSGGSSGGSGSGQLLTGGRGLTNGAALSAGEFQVEYYCNRQGYGITNDNNNWYCTSGGRRVQTLGQSDFNRICRETYNNSSAYAVRDGRNRIAAYNWRCYG
jgi:Tol biopolymer transport system component